METNSTLLWIPLLPIIGAAFNILFGRHLSRRTVHVVGVGVIVAAFVVALTAVAGPLWDAFAAWKNGTDGAGAPILRQHLYTWIEVGRLKLDFTFHLDTLSAVMILIITFVGSLIHLYSTGYMSHEPRYAAYFGYLNLFTGSMLVLVLGANMPMMFIGWEGVGLCSYLLIGFWFENENYATAGRKAFVVNRIGDFAFILGMFVLFWGMKASGAESIGLDFMNLRSPAAVEMFESSYNSVRMIEPSGGFLDERFAFFAGLLFFIGACGKSAQIPLYVWLPDAMAGPTPVSALIHAATMVTAGVYMIARLSFLYMSSATAMAIVAGIGALTALLAAFMAFAQTDLKKVLAYSTVSQLGFMFVAVGSGAFVAGIFHLMTHAFFKAGLFLGAGSVMHAMSGSGDMTKMGGLRRKLPITHGAFFVYCWAIAGLPLMSGFFSKDEILAGAFFANGEGWFPGYGYILFGILTLAAIGTAIYMYRLYFMVFSGECRADEETQSHIHESPPSMTIPLAVLGVLAVFAGFLGLPHIGSLPNLLGSWLVPSIFYDGNGLASTLVDYEMAGHFLDGKVVKMVPHSAAWIGGLMGAATLFAIIGVAIAYKLFNGKTAPAVDHFVTSERGSKLYDLSKNKLYVDEIYEKAFIGPFRNVAMALFKFVDKFVIDGVFVNGSAFVVDFFSKSVLSRVQNGNIQRYIAAMCVGLATVFVLAWRTNSFIFSTSPEMKWKEKGEGVVEVEILPGFGPESKNVTVHWDFDGDDKADVDEQGKKLIGTVQSRWLDPKVGHKVKVWTAEEKTGDTNSGTLVVPVRGAN